MPTFPDLLPSTTFSFTSAYSHQTQHVPTSSTPRRQRSNSANRRRPTRRESDQNHSNPENPTNGAYNGARRDDSRHAQANGQAVTRARTRRILLGERPVGTQLTRESEELSDQEEAVYHAEVRECRYSQRCCDTWLRLRSTWFTDGSAQFRSRFPSTSRTSSDSD